MTVLGRHWFPTALPIGVALIAYLLPVSDF